MRALAASVLLLGACATSPLQPEAAAPPEMTAAQLSRAQLAGAWRLVSYEDQAAGKTAIHPYGLHPEGLVIYDPSGAMSIQIMAVPHPKVASGTDQKVTAAEKVALFDAYLAYFGTWTVDAARGVVIHHVEGDIADLFIGDDEERPFGISGNILVLRPEWELNGVRWTGTRTFERVR